MATVPTRDTLRLLESLTTEYERQVKGSPGEKYLEARGIGSEARNYFRLGFVLEPSPEEAGYRNRISIPYIIGTHIVGIKYRVIDSREPRYMSSVGFNARRIFNPDILKSLHRKVYLCEGELDAITLHNLGVPAIAIPGANNWNPVVARALRNRRVIVLQDGDGKPGKGAEAGPNLAKQVLSSVDDAGRIVMEGTDVNQFFLDHGEAELLDYIGWGQ